MRGVTAHGKKLSILCCLAAAAVVAGVHRTVAAQQAAPSLYLGLGTGTNIGGTVGLGVEVRLGRYLSTSAAVGIWPEAFREESLAREAFDFDVGVKVYPAGRWFFTGVNYGIIHGEITASSTNQFSQMRKRRGFTFSLGLRTPARHGLYAAGFAGVTSDRQANYLVVFDRRTFMPHFGLMFGYELSSAR